MAEIVRQCIHSFADGFRDAILGIAQFYNRDNASKKQQQPERPLTVLARRRADRIRHQNEESNSDPPNIISRIGLCCAWNGGLFMMSIIVFNHLVLPGLKYIFGMTLGSSGIQMWKWVGPFLSWTFDALWILPLFLLSKIVNTIWFQDIADSAYRKSRGRPQLFPSISKIIADILFSILMQALFLIQGMCANLLPIWPIGFVLLQLHMSLLYSVYAFEYKWFNMGWELHKRLSYIECNWPYFVGFGTPMVLCIYMAPSFIISGCIFSILFPLFIISANEAEPIEESFELRLRLFAPVVYMCNFIFRQSVAMPSASSHNQAQEDNSGNASHATHTSLPQQPPSLQHRKTRFT